MVALNFISQISELGSMVPNFCMDNRLWIFSRIDSGGHKSIIL
ncbi:hypothetical protein LLO_p4100 (plasmid) [Legionella longbeachae NSW150]|uniref:Uncharacterized protein n=1 Tax=Legionella longbeachae serogroup 1 (strain NSW150) TaxID=661367 RepID=D3HTX5_LEGLN|nr:hypothetical protein LLB_3779 [Legionella longbeachae D-4968]CBJ13988.1 hypothetical protein LLO_p4100 [Legionella longbeachae NSW150]